MVPDLLREQLADIARAENDGVLDVGLVPARQRPCSGPCKTDERDRGGPEHDELLRGRIRDVAEVRDDDD